MIDAYGEYSVVIVFILLVIAWGVAMVRLLLLTRRFSHREWVTPRQTIEHIPSVSVCIPARNEMHAMTECLESIISSTYPKLEIIVLDDSSSDTTSTVIKAFAHEGIRFVEGSTLPTGWLGKNHALQELLGQASGTYVLFMDVDTRLQPDTIEQLVAYTQDQKQAMISVLPRREDGWRASVLFSPLRYFWELIFHRKNMPASASSAWMIERQLLIDQGGFVPMKAAIQPESVLAAQLTSRYHFLIGSPSLGVSYEKKWRSQLATSSRLLFPLLGKRVWLALLATAGLFLLLCPVIVLLSTIGDGWHRINYAASTVYLLYALPYGIYTLRVWRRGWWLAALLWPVIVLQEAVLVIISIQRYLFKRVTWKGRPVTVDVSK